MADSKGIQRTATGFRAYVRLKGFPLQTKRFPPTTAPEVMRAWRELTRAKLLIRRDEGKADEPLPGTFRADARRYLDAVAAMRSIKDRRRDIAVWVALFADRPRASIRRDEIQAQRDRWALYGPRLVQRTVNGTVVFVEIAEPLSASAINHRLRALSNLWTVLDGRRAPNPVRDVAEVDEPDLAPRALSYKTIDKVLKAMADSASKARLMVMAYTGIRPAQLMRLTPADVDLHAKTVTLPSSRKGKKHRRTPTKPLTKDGVKAFRLFQREHAWGRVVDGRCLGWSQSALGKAWRRACRKAGVKDTRAYDLRHSFGTRMLLQTKNLATVAEFLDHGDLRTTQRYTLAAKHVLMTEAAKKW